MSPLSRLRWEAGLRPGTLLWVAFLLWETAGLRTTMGAGHTFASVVDDLAMGAAALSVFLLLEWLPRGPRTVLALLVGLFLVLFGAANAVHFAFFRTFVNVESILILGLVPAAQTSVTAVLDVRTTVFALGFPLAVLAGTLWQLGRVGPRRTLGAAAGAATTAGVLLLVHPALTEDDFAVNRSNALVHVTRQAVDLLAETIVPEDLAPVIADSLEETYNLPSADDYRTGVSDRYPLLREPVEPRAPDPAWNVVVILLESVRSHEMGLGTGRPSVTPRIDALAEEGLTFHNIYAGGHQTVRGEVAILCSISPHVGGAPVYFRFPLARTSCLPEILRDHGYATYWISSYTANYANKRLFLSRHGIDRIYDGDLLAKRDLKKPKVGWGPSDEDMFDFAAEILSEAPEPFFAEVMTLSNHHPFNHAFGIPRPRSPAIRGESGVYRNYFTGVHYTDYAVGRFLDSVRDEPWFERTIFVVTGDHGTWNYPRRLERRRRPVEKLEMASRMPLVFWGKPLTVRGARDEVGGQIDIAPTLLDLLEMRAPNAFQGVSLLADIPPERRFALVSDANGWSIRQGSSYCYQAGRDCLPEGTPLCEEGRTPRPATHACFRTDADLLGAWREIPATTPLPSAERDALLRRGRNLARFNRWLLSTDRLFAPEGPEPRN